MRQGGCGQRKGRRGGEPSSPPSSPPLHFQGVCAWVLVQDHTNLWFSSNFKRFAEPSLTLNFGATASFVVKNLGEVTLNKEGPAGLTQVPNYRTGVRAD